MESWGMAARSTATAHPHPNRMRATGCGNLSKRTQHAFRIGLLAGAAFGQHFVEDFARAFLVAHFDIGTREVELGSDFVELAGTAIAEFEIEAAEVILAGCAAVLQTEVQLQSVVRRSGDVQVRQLELEALGVELHRVRSARSRRGGLEIEHVA